MKKRRIIRSLVLDEVSAVGTPAMAGALHKLTKSEPHPVAITAAFPPVAVDALRQFADVTQARLNITKEDSTMSNDTTSAYDSLVAKFSDKWDLSPAVAAIKLLRERGDLVAKAYEADTAAYTQRQVDKRKAAYGDAA